MLRLHWQVFLFLVMFLPGQCRAAAGLEVLPEFLRPDPFGGIVAPDRSGADLRSSLYDARHRVALTGARGGYRSEEHTSESSHRALSRMPSSA